MDVYFSDFFGVDPNELDEYGAFDISLITDLPLFIDPFLLFNSEKEEYQTLHEYIIGYLRFLKDKATSGPIDSGLIRTWFLFPEVKQTWLGFTYEGNRGRGLGPDFAEALNRNLVRLFMSFGEEQVTRGTHLEKLCLIKPGVGRDTISDFTTNLIKGYLCEYTETFAREHIDSSLTKRVMVPKVQFNYRTETWISREFTLPIYNNDYVLLTPKDMLTRDDVWINRADFLRDYNYISIAVSNEQLRGELDNYLRSTLSDEPNAKEIREAYTEFALTHPETIDYYIRYKEERGDLAVDRSVQKVFDSEQLYIKRFGTLVNLLAENTNFYELTGVSESEAYERIMYLKQVIEHNGGWRIFYNDDGIPVRNENDLHILYKLTWFASVSDISHEVNDGRGPVDFKASHGSKDVTLVELKLASNTQLKRNLQHQLEIYQQASNTDIGYKVIVFFTEAQQKKVEGILEELGLTNDEHIITIDARNDNKPSASIAQSH